MIEKHRYWYFNTLSKKFINDLLLYGKQQELGDGVIGKSNEPLEKKELYKTRKSKVAFINKYWINKEIAPFINDANINLFMDGIKILFQSLMKIIMFHL